MEQKQNFRRLQEAAVGLLEAQVPLFEAAYGGTEAESAGGRRVNNLLARIESLKNEQFVVVVLGEFNRGKSTFLNALLGEPVFVKDASESTACVGFLKHSAASLRPEQADKAVVYFQDGREPKPIEKRELRDYTTYLSKVETVAKSVAYVDIYAESRFVEGNVVLVDTPGVNGVHENHARITHNQIERSNAAIYLFQAGQAFTWTDLAFLRDIRSKIQRFFFLVNRIDQIPEGDRDRILKHVETQIAEHLKLPRDQVRVYGVSALKGLLGRYGYVDANEIVRGADRHLLDDQSTRDAFLQESQMVRFEEDLYEYLFRGGKARDILESQVHLTLNNIAELESDLEKQLAVLDGSLQLDALARQEKELQRSIEDQKLELESTTAGLSEKLENSLKAGLKEIEADLNSCELELKDTLDSYSLYDSFIDAWEELKTMPERKLNLCRIKGARILEERIRTVFNAEDRRLRAKLSTALGELKAFSPPDLPSFSISLREVAVDPEQERGLQALRAEIDALEREEARLLKSFNPTALAQLKEIQNRQDNLQKEQLAQLQLLGTRPRIETNDIRKRVQEERGGFFGFFGNVLFGPKSVDVVVTTVDDSGRRNYDKQKTQIESIYTEQLKKIDDEVRKHRKDWSEAEQARYRAEQTARELERKQGQVTIAQQRMEENRKKIEQAALVTNKTNLRRAFNHGREVFFQEFERIVLENSDLVGGYLSAVTAELDDHLQQLTVEFDALKELKNLKEGERALRESAIRGQLERAASVRAVASSLEEELKAFFHELNFA